MRCLMCGRIIGENSLRDLFLGDDLLCSECRNAWQYIGRRFTVGSIPAFAEYAYNDAFRECLLQYKECGDEALKDVFLYPRRDFFRRKYRGCTLLLMPSTQENTERRGFSHLRLMYAGMHMPMLEIFEKQENRTQKEMGYEERQKTEDEIVLKEGIKVPKKVVLCDDVLTTGSTIRGALKALQDIPCRKYIHTAAYVEKKHVS